MDLRSYFYKVYFMEINPSLSPSLQEDERHYPSTKMRINTFQTNEIEEWFPTDIGKLDIGEYKFAKSKKSDIQSGNRCVSFDR